MSAESYITSSCIISNYTVTKNGQALFKSNDADVPGFLFSVYQHFDLKYSRFYKMDNLSKLGWLASEILLKYIFDKENYKPEEIGIVLSNANSSLDSDQRYIDSVKDTASPALFVYTLPNIMIGEICIRNNFKGEGTFFIAEYFYEVLIHDYVRNLLKYSNLNACICGWVELFDDNYKAALFLVEKQSGKQSLPFTIENINKIFEAK